MLESRPVKPARKGVYILPNLFTAGSMFVAFWGILAAFNGNYSNCAIAIFGSALLDGMDGKVARLTNSASDFGVQMDSLADAIAFGTTPALMVYLWELQELGRLGMGIAFLFMACGVLRLARFNIMTGTISKKYFIGLPIPAAACVLASLVLFNHYLPKSTHDYLPAVALGLTFVLALLMVSRIRYFSFKELGFVKAKPLSWLVVALLLFVLIVTEPRMMGFAIVVGYLVSGPVYTFGFLRRKTAADAKSEQKQE
jgi:CDP-diacylglycerol--serine O-phosphatidyltransferase